MMRRSTIEGIKSPLEAQLLGLIGAASSVERDRDELLASLRRAETAHAAAQEQAEQLHSENEELRQALAELQAAHSKHAEADDTAAASAADSEQAAAELLYEAQRTVDELTAQLESERAEREALEVVVQERTAALESLEREYHAMLHLRGGGADAGPQGQPEGVTEGVPAEPPAEPVGGLARGNRGGGGGGGGGRRGRGIDAWRGCGGCGGAVGRVGGVEARRGEPSGSRGFERGRGGDEGDGAAGGGGGGRPVRCGRCRAGVACRRSCGCAGRRGDGRCARGGRRRASGRRSAAAPEAAPKDDKPTLGKLQWFGFRLPSAEESAPSAQFRTKFPPMAATISNGSGTVVLAGGGGASKTGIPNAIVFAAVTENGECVQRAHHGTGLEAVTGISFSEHARVLACVQGDGVEIYELLKSNPADDANAADAADADVGLRAAAAARVGAAPERRPAQRDAEHASVHTELRAAAGLPGLRRLPRPDWQAAGRGDGGWLTARLLVRRRWRRRRRRGRTSALGAGTARGGAHQGAQVDGFLVRRLHPMHVRARWARATLGHVLGRTVCRLAHGRDPQPPRAHRGHEARLPPLQPIRRQEAALSRQKKDLSAQWRCVAMPAGRPAKGSRAAPPLFAALNHPGGPGWLVRADSKSGRVRAWGKACASMVPTLAVSDDGSLIVAGNSEGELLVFDSGTISRLMRVCAHDLFITSLLLREAAPSGLGALTGGVTYTAITCCGDNSVKLTPLPAAALKRRTNYTPIVLLSLFVALLAWLLQTFPSLQPLLLPSAVQPLVATMLNGAELAAADSVAAQEVAPTSGMQAPTEGMAPAAA